MTCLAGRRSAPFVPIRRVSEATGVPAPVLTKTLARLARAGLVISRRGPGGGVRLARPAAQITVSEIVAAIDGQRPWTRCVLGFHHCDDDDPCPVHESWKSVREAIDETLHARTLAALAPLMKPRPATAANGRSAR